MSNSSLPNVLMVSFDALRPDFAYSGDHNPHNYGIDTVFDIAKKRGVTFTEAITSGNWTIPSHASLFTGLEPQKHLLLNWGQSIPSGINTIFDEAKKNQYETFFLASDGLEPLVLNRKESFTLFGRPIKKNLEKINTLTTNPKFVFLHFLHTHAPYNMKLPKEVDLHNVDIDHKRPIYNYIRELICTDQIDTIHEALVENYLAISKEVEKIWESLGVSNTIVVLLSDHGEDWRPYHPFHCSFEVPVLKIPLVISAPGLRPTANNSLISHSDLLELLWKMIDAYRDRKDLNKIFNNWVSSSEKMGRVVVAGPDAFNNEEPFFGICDKERMVVIQTSTTEKRRYYINSDQRQEVDKWNVDDKNSIDLEHKTDAFCEYIYGINQEKYFHEEDTDNLLKHLEDLGYI